MNTLVSKKIQILFLIALMSCVSHISFADGETMPTSTNPFITLLHGHPEFQLGYFWTNQGQSQQVNIDGLIGDYFTVTNAQSSNGLFGVGYYLDGYKQDYFDLDYGINFFYLPRSGVFGTVTQEGLFTNLSFEYDITHHPLYFLAKSTLKLPKLPNNGLTIDVGIGPNFMYLTNFQEQSIDDGVTLPDYIFTQNSTTQFSVTVGAGLKFNNVFGHSPVECGYRFFYLGQGSFTPTSNEVLTALSTGQNYAHAITCGLIM